MLDLTEKVLPNHIEVAGRIFLLNTDFRLWIKFGRMLQEEHTWEDYYFLFKESHPIGNFLNQLLEFYNNPNSTPNIDDGGSGERIFDFYEDGEYIYASFIHEYGIDLYEIDMHWHKFQALFRALPDDAYIKKIMSYRSYEKQNNKDRDIYEEYKRIWELPLTEAELTQRQKELDEFNAL